MKILSLFSGIGAFEKALTNLGVKYELEGFSEIDKYAIKSYCAIHNVDESLNLGDISKIDIEGLSDDIDLITHGSPCTDYSVAGKGLGGDENSNTRSSLMWHTVNIVSHKQPKYVIWENVKNVLSKNHKHNFDKYLSELEKLGYRNYYKVLNSKNFNVPQNRERIFVVSIRNDIDTDFVFDEGYDTGIRLRDILENEVDNSFYINNEKTVQLLKNLNDKVDLSKDCIGTCHKKNDMSFATRDRVYNIDKLSPTLTATDYKDAKKILFVGDVEQVRPCLTPDRLVKRQNGRRFKNNDEPAFTLTSQDRHGILVAGNYMPSGHEAGRIVEVDGVSPTMKENHGTVISILEPVVVGDKYYKIRKLTPLECFRLQAFSVEDYEKAAKVCSKTQLYKQAGNSITVTVLEKIFINLLK